MDDDMIGLIISLVVIAVLVAAVIYNIYSKKKYMNKQKETGEDKRAMLDLMAQVAGEAYSNFKYVVGYYTKTTRSGRTTTYYYFPYILAFNAATVEIYSFIKKEGKLYIRNRLPVDWSSTKFHHTTKKGGVRVDFTIAGERMPIHVDAVISSSGVEKSDRPLGIYQEQELEEFKSYLPKYQEMSRK